LDISRRFIGSGSASSTNPEIRDWVLELGFANMHYLDLYLPEPDGDGYEERQTGVLRPFKAVKFLSTISLSSWKSFPAVSRRLYAFPK
jgi:hypothetical protein